MSASSKRSLAPTFWWGKLDSKSAPILRWPLFLFLPVLRHSTFGSHQTTWVLAYAIALFFARLCTFYWGFPWFMFLAR